MADWLQIDRNFIDSPNLEKVEALSDGSFYSQMMMKLALKVARKPFVAGRDDIFPCDADALAKEINVQPSSIKAAVNAFYHAGLVRKLTEDQLSVVVHGGAECRSPSFEDVKAFAEAENLAVDVQWFYDYYKASGFKYHGQIMDWKAKMREWAATERPTRPKAKHGSAFEFYRNRQQPKVDLAALEETYSNI